jgi:hypothetical protein
MSSMPDPREIPELTSELIDMSREYLRQETIEPAKRLGKHAGMGLGGAAVLGLGAIFVIWGLYNALTMWLPEGEWWVVLSRLITALTAAGAAGVVVWMMQRPGKAAVGDET